MFNLDTTKIKQDILKLKSKDKGRTVSNYGGWQSKAFYDVDKNLKSLFNKINVIVESIEKKLCLSYKIKLGNYWHNVNGFGSFNRPHDHPKSVISGVYYISVPKNSGKIVLEYNAKQVNIVAKNNANLEISVDDMTIPDSISGGDLNNNSRISVLR